MKNDDSKRDTNVGQKGEWQCPERHKKGDEFFSCPARDLTVRPERLPPGLNQPFLCCPTQSSCPGLSSIPCSSHAGFSTLGEVGTSLPNARGATLSFKKVATKFY